MRARHWQGAAFGLATLALLLGTAGRAGAGPVSVFNTFGPGDTFSGSDQATNPSGYVVSGSSTFFRAYLAQAAAFTPSATVNLGQVRFAAFTNFLLDAQSLDVVVAADAGGAPGAPLESFPAVNVPDSDFGTIIALTSSAHPLLTQGVPYWLVLEPHDPTTTVGWNDSSPPVSGNMSRGSSPSGPWTPEGSPLAAFQILGDPPAPPPAGVPEPSTLALLGVGAAALAGRRRWKRRQTEG